MAHSRRRRLLVTAATWLVVAVAAWYLLRLLRRVSWPQVWDAVAGLELWHVAVLLVVVAMRQAFNAAPLALFVPGLRLRRAMVNDAAGTLVAMVAPAPSDIVLRLAMFRSWGIDATTGFVGLTLNSVVYYVARFAAPALGLAAVLAWTGYDPAFGWPAVSSGVVAVAILVALVIAVRAESSAAAIGRLAGRLVGRLRRDPSAAPRVEAQLVDFQRHAAARLKTGGLASALVTAALLLTETALLVLSLRFVGVSSQDAPALLIAACLLCAYPTTALPLLGLGVLDAAVIALLADRSSAQAEDLVAGLVVFRVGMQIVPMALGLAALLHWRRTRAQPPAETADPSSTPS